MNKKTKKRSPVGNRFNLRKLVADALAARGHYFYALARRTSNPSTRDHLLRLASDYFEQAHEFRHAKAPKVGSF
jgi:hypothetical protein